MCADVTQLYLDTVKKQCASLGLQELVDKYMNKKMEKLSASDFLDNDQHTLKRVKKEKEQELKKVMNENDHIDEELKKLDNLKNSRDFMSMPKKDRVLVLKKMKKLSDMSEKNQQLEDIRKSNQSNQLRAKQMRDKQYRDSHQVKSALKEKEEELYEAFEDEDFDDPNKLKQIKEEEEDEDIDERINNLKVRKEHNTHNLDSLREELKQTTQKYPRLTAGSTPAETRIWKSPTSPPSRYPTSKNPTKWKSRTTRKKTRSTSSSRRRSKSSRSTQKSPSRCINGIGESKFKRALTFLKEKKSQSQEELYPKVCSRPTLTSDHRRRPDRLLAPDGPDSVL